MKLRESGMPAQAYWETLLDVPFILDAFGFIADSATGDIAELGCGYGTFTLSTAGAWTYTMGSAHDAFAAGTDYTDSFKAVSADGTTQTIPAPR